MFQKLKGWDVVISCQLHLMVFFHVLGPSKAHFNPQLMSWAKMSLNMAQNVFMPLNIHSFINFCILELLSIVLKLVYHFLSGMPIICCCVQQTLCCSSQQMLSFSLWEKDNISFRPAIRSSTQKPQCQFTLCQLCTMLFYLAFILGEVQ